jgi:hypothetical protein
MRNTLLFPAAAASLALLGGCEMRIGNDAAPVADNASASGKAEEGRVTVEAPGFNLSINVPEGLSSRANVDADSGLVYPGSAMGGLHVQGSNHDERGREHGEVEIRFTSADPTERVVAWYRDPARASDFTIATASRDGNATVLSGTGRRENERFTVRIAPHGEGGTEMRLLLTDNER